MNYLKKIFNSKPSRRIRLSKENIVNWPYYFKRLKEGKLKFDKDGTPKYKESADEWFDPNGDKAKKFVWPEN